MKTAAIHQHHCPVCGRITETRNRGIFRLELCAVCTDFEGGRLGPNPELRRTVEERPRFLRLKDLSGLDQIDLPPELRDLIVVLHIFKRADLETGASLGEIRSSCRGVTENDIRRGLRLLVDDFHLVVKEDDLYRLRGNKDDLVRALRQRLDQMHAN